MKRIGVYVFLVCFLFSFIAKADNLLKNPSFEEGLENWNIPSWIENTIKVEIDRSIFQGPGNASLKMVGEEGKRGILMQSVVRNPDVKRYRISGWMKTKDFENGWYAEITAECVFQKDGKQQYAYYNIITQWDIHNMDWTKFEKEFEVPEGTTQIRVLLQTKSPSGKLEPGNKGTVWFDNICLEELVDETNKITIKNFYPLGEKGLFVIDELPEFILEVVNGYNKEKEVKLDIIVKDFYDKEVYKKEYTLKLIPLSILKQQITLPSQKEFGFYGVNITLEENNLPLATDVSSFCVFSVPDTLNPFFGMNWNSSNPVKALRLMGAGTVGILIPWYCEKERGVYDWSGIDKAVDSYIKEGFRIIGAFSMHGEHYTEPNWILRGIKERRERGQEPFSEEYYQEFGKFVEEAVTRYKDRIKIWSLCQEIDLGIEREPEELDRYVKKVKIVYQTAKKVDPNCIVGGVGVSGVDGQKNPRFPAAKKIWPLVYNNLDGMFFDAYVDPKKFGPGYTPIGPERGNFKDILLSAKELIGQYGKNKLAIDEKGYSIVSALPVDSPYAKDLAKVLSRGYIIAKSVPEVDRWLYFLSVGCYEGDVDYGLWKEKKGFLSPRPSVASYGTTARMLSNTDTEVEEINLHKDIYCYVFKKGEGSVSCLWTILKEPVSLLMELPEDVQVYNLMGNKEKTIKKGKNEIILNNEVLFLVSSIPAKKISQSISNASYSLPLVKGDIRLTSSSTLVVDIVNQTDRELNSKIEVIAEGITFPTKEGVLIPCNKTLPVEFQTKDSISLLNNKEVTAKITIEGRTTTIKEYIDIYPVVKSKEKVVIDGNLDEYKNISPIVLDNPKFLFPVDALSNKLWTSSDDLSYKVYLTYDEENFYFAACVVDDIFIQEKTGSSIWANDSFQIGFDTLNNALSPEIGGRLGYDIDDYEYGIALTKEGPQCYCWTASVENKQLENKLMNFPLAIKRINPTTTNYELAIPWKYLLPLHVEKGRAFGFSFAYLDSDTSGTASYWMGLTPGIVNGKDPSAFKTFILVD